MGIVRSGEDVNGEIVFHCYFYHYLLRYIEEDVLPLWTVGFFSHCFSVLSVREAKYHIVPFLSECNTNSDRKAQMYLRTAWAVLLFFIDKN